MYKCNKEFIESRIALVRLNILDIGPLPVVVN